jgi:hypothetical protein
MMHGHAHLKLAAHVFCRVAFKSTSLFNNSLFMCDAVKSGTKSPIFQTHVLCQQRHISRDSYYSHHGPEKSDLISS